MSTKSASGSGRTLKPPVVFSPQLFVGGGAAGAGKGSRINTTVHAGAGIAPKGKAPAAASASSSIVAESRFREVGSIKRRCIKRT